MDDAKAREALEALVEDYGRAKADAADGRSFLDTPDTTLGDVIAAADRYAEAYHRSAKLAEARRSVVESSLQGEVLTLEAKMDLALDLLVEIGAAHHFGRVNRAADRAQAALERHQKAKEAKVEALRAVGRAVDPTGGED